MPFSNFPDAAYLRVFAFDRALTKEEIASVGGVIEPFLLTWKAHGLVIPSAWSLQEGQVLLFAADTTQVPMKGCSGDSLFGLLADDAQLLGGEDALHQCPLGYSHSLHQKIQGQRPACSTLGSFFNPQQFLNHHQHLQLRFQLSDVRCPMPLSLFLRGGRGVFDVRTRRATVH